MLLPAPGSPWRVKTRLRPARTSAVSRSSAWHWVRRPYSLIPGGAEGGMVISSRLIPVSWQVRYIISLLWAPNTPQGNPPDRPVHKWSGDDTNLWSGDDTSPLGRNPLAQRLPDDLDPALRPELGEDVGDVGLHRSAGQEHAAGDVRRRVAPGDQGGDLDLGRGECLPAGGRAWRASAPVAALDAVGAK